MVAGGDEDGGIGGGNGGEDKLVGGVGGGKGDEGVRHSISMLYYKLD